jgi:regulator of protease activity HflC (stomatin/prohibitin superfamily)
LRPWSGGHGACPKKEWQMEGVCVAFVALGVLLCVVFVLASLRVVQEYERAIVFRLGRLKGIQGPGMFLLNPIIERATNIDMRTRTVDIEPQEAMTKDSVTVRVNAVLYYSVFEPKLAVLSVADYHMATNQAALTTLRNIIGQNDLDTLLKERDRINDTLKEIIDKVEMKAVEIPENMQRAMAREAEALRERRARLIKASSELDASQKLMEASEMIEKHPAALELRRMQMIAEVGSEQNTTTIILMPSEFVTLARSASEFLGNDKRARLLKALDG